MLDPRDIPTPSRTQRRLFAAMLAVFLPLLGWLAATHPSGLLIAAGVTAMAATASMLLNRDLPLRLGVISLVIPAVLTLLGGIGREWDGASWLTVGMAPIGLAVAVLVWLSAAWGEAIYRRWLLTAMPIGWSVAALAMTIIFYLILTPTGLAMRLAGRDTMRRCFDPAATTYWLPRQPVTDKTRYFRQY